MSVSTFNEIIENYDPKKNESINILTKFEKTKIIGTRLEQLARGSKALVNTAGLTNIRDIALKEFEENKLPFIVCRTLPSGAKEYWKLKDIKKNN